ncbi:MAG: PAS domain-containing sensor histidine kinase [Lentisphaerota bacterium]
MVTEKCSFFDTNFASPDKASADELKAEIETFYSDGLLNAILDAVPDLTLILNKYRQIVFANRAMLDYLGENDLLKIVGLRPGELLGCSHAKDVAGCGTTEFCRVCGSVRAILNSQNNNKDVQECAITSCDGGKAFNFRVWTTPYERAGALYTIYMIRDIADEKFRALLEHVFFHDLTNTSSGIYGLLSMVEGDAEKFKEYSGILLKLSQQLLEEIGAQRDLVMAENNEIVPMDEATSSMQILKDVFDLYSNSSVAANKKLRLDQNSADIDFCSDKRLVRRVIGNMTKNALEASGNDDIVTIGNCIFEDKIRFFVNNPIYISRDIQLNMFKRSFSTKGAGRGLGTYSMKLLTEKFLGGTVSFVSDPDRGTSFYADYPLKTTGNK